MKKILLLILFCLFSLPAHADNTILIIGDSLSAAYGINPQKGWTELLQQRLTANHYPYKVVNASITGNTTSEGLARLPEALKQHKPKITIVELGGNDGLRGLPLGIIKSNLEKMVNLITAANSKILIIAIRLPPNYGNDYTKQFEAVFVNVAKQSKAAFVPYFLKDIDNQEKFMQPDGIHPTESAQETLLNNIWPALSKLLSK